MDLEEQKKLVIPFLQVRRSLGASEPWNLGASCTSVENLLKAVCVLQRAQEIQKVDPRVAYYCRMYALEEVRLTATVVYAGDTDSRAFLHRCSCKAKKASQLPLEEMLCSLVRQQLLKLVVS